MKKEEENYVPTIFPWNQNSEDRTTKNAELSRIPLQSLDNRIKNTALDSSGNQVIFLENCMLMTIKYLMVNLYFYLTT